MCVCNVCVGVCVCLVCVCGVLCWCVRVPGGCVVCVCVCWFVWVPGVCVCVCVWCVSGAQHILPVPVFSCIMSGFF